MTATKSRSRTVALLRAMRPRQWVKNALVFVGLIFSLNLTHLPLLLAALVAFLVFCTLSSAGYLANDLVDIEADRQHPRKSQRPIAAGLVSPRLALVAASLLLLSGLGAAFLVRLELGMLALAYLGLTLSYSAWLKHVVLLDVFAIAAGFVVRAVAGAVAVAVPISPWLYVCTILGALLFALGKRRHELVLLEEQATSHRRALSEYSVEFVDQLLVIVSAGSIMAYSLYTFSAENLPADHAMMLTIPLVLYGVFRYLFLVRRRGLGGAPEDLLLADKPLALAVVSWALASIVILYVGALEIGWP